jgi:hypothetical protein
MPSLYLLRNQQLQLLSKEIHYIQFPQPLLVLPLNTYPAELRSPLQGGIRALDSKFKICFKKLANFRICYKALTGIYRNLQLKSIGRKQETGTYGLLNQ